MANARKEEDNGAFWIYGASVFTGKSWEKRRGYFAGLKEDNGASPKLEVCLIPRSLPQTRVGLWQ